MPGTLKGRRNKHAQALYLRTGHAGTAITAGTRPRIVRPKKGKGSYRRTRQDDNRKSASDGLAAPLGDGSVSYFV